MQQMTKLKKLLKS